jgi:hypothetical protein
LASCWSTFSLIISKVDSYLISDVKWRGIELMKMHA